MAKRVPLSSVVVVRDGKKVIPKVGEPFDFNNDELKDIAAAEKATGQAIVRKLVNEGAEVENTTVVKQNARVGKDDGKTGDGKDDGKTGDGKDDGKTGDGKTGDGASL